MKKHVLSLLLAVLLFLILSPAAHAEEDVLTSEQDVLDYIAEQKEAGTEEFEFSCEQELFDDLLANNGFKLHRLEVKSGIADARIRYYENTRTFMLSRVEYTDMVWAECETEKDVRQALQTILNDGNTEFTLLMSSDLAKSLASSGSLKNYAAQAGYIGIQFSYYTNGDVVGKDPEPISLDYTVVDDTAQFDAAIEGYAEAEKDEFIIVFTPSFYNKISDDQEQMRVLHATSKLDEYRYISGGAWGVLRYYDVSYTDEPTTLCYDEDDMVEAIARMGSLGITDFRLYMIGDELRDAIISNGLAGLHEVEAKAGMTTASTSFSRSTIYYTDANIVSDVKPLNTMDEVLEYMAEKTAEGAEDITLFCTAELYSEILGKVGGFSFTQDGMDPIYDLVSQSGIFDYDLSASRTTGAIMIHVTSYYPGTEILRAIENGTEDELPERLQETLERARELADECLTEDDPLETARAIHDALCERIVYTDDEETDEDDTAIGAILNGEANCDGYSDAFCLIGTLAGLTVRYQHGDSLVRGFGMPAFGGNPITHMWNLLLLDDTWRMVDVTWDDGESGPDYTWFNLGQDRASRTHIWNEDMTVEMLKETDMEARPGNEYSVNDADELAEAVNLAFARGENFSLIFDDEDYVDNQGALDLIRNQAQASFQYSWIQEMRQLKVYIN